MDVFMSYRRVGGSGWANFLYSEFTKMGIEVFLDVQKMQNGMFYDQIVKNIKEAPNFLLLLTPGALEKRNEDEVDYMRKEIGVAISCKKNIIVVCLEGYNVAEIDKNETTQMKHLKGREVVYFSDKSPEDIEAGIKNIVKKMKDIGSKDLCPKEN